MLYVLSLLTTLARYEASESTSGLADTDHLLRRAPSLRSTVAGPLRVKYLNVENLEVGSMLESASNYFYHALSIYNLVVPVTVSCDNQDVSITDADVVVIFKSTAETYPYGFKGVTCANEGSPMQYPVAGIIYCSNLNPNEMLPLIISSTMRILGLDYNQVTKWKKNQQGDLYDTDLIIEAESNGVMKNFLRSPKALQKVREAFNNLDLVGIELEDHPSAQGMMFWELRQYRLEVMSLGIPYDIYVATFTLAALEDSGWYFANYEMSNLPYLGRNLGESYFSQPCKYGEAGVDGGMWCLSENIFNCNPLRLSVSYCDYASAYPSDSLADGCPISSKTSEICRYPGMFQYKPYVKFGLKSRCMEVGPLEYVDGMCFEIASCSESSAVVKFFDTLVECPFTGGRVSIPGTELYFTCPSSDVLCQEIPCYNLCYGNGKCVKGTCQCFEGFSGEACEIKCSANCLHCESSSLCSECSKGFYLQISTTSRICLKCPEFCLTCYDDRCFSCVDGFSLDGHKCKKHEEDSDDSDDQGNSSNCPGNCESCSSSQCSKCRDGFYLAENKCRNCDKSCKTCNGPWECLTCNSGYDLAFKLCCPSKCSSCSTSACYTCRAGYFLSRGKCIDCPDNCTRCANGVCELCKKGYFGVGGYCSECPKECSACVSLSWCDGCKDGFSLLNGKCSK